MKKITFLILTFLISAWSWQVAAQAGSTCDDPFVVTSMPFSHAGNTADYGNNYTPTDVPGVATGAVTTGTGSSYYLDGDDVVYSYTAGANGSITIETTNDDDWIGLWAFEGCPFASTVGYHTSTSGATRSISNLPVMAGETYFIVLSGWSISTDYTISITGTDVGDPPTCIKPTNLTLDDVTTDSAEISWTAGGDETEWEVTYGESGFDVETEGTTVTVNDSPEYQITGLTANMDYQVYIRAICDVDDESALAGPLNIATACEATNVPFTQDFEDVTVPAIPSCGSLEVNNGNPWKTSSITSQGFSGKVLMYGYHTTTGDADSWYFTQGINLEAGVEYSISYQYGNNTTTYTEKLRVAFGTSPVSSAMTEELADHVFNINTSEVAEETFTVATDGIYYFGFQAHSATNQFNMYLDNIHIDQMGDTFPSPYCDVPDTSVEEITKVVFDDTTITNDDSDSVLIDKTDTVVDVTAGETYTISVEGNTYGDFETNIVAFIDWNQNEILDDEGEIYELGTLENSTGADGVMVSMDIEVPANAVLGETRIRVMKTYFDDMATAVVNPCAIEFDLFGSELPSFGQALDFTLNVVGGGDDTDDCAQGDDSNGFENAFNITSGGSFRNADDFMVSADNTLNIRSIELNIFANEPVTSVDINFYSDDNGAPGTLISQSVTDAVPYAQVQVGANFGYNVYAVFVEVDLDFEGGANGTTYWMQPAAEAAAAFWEVTTAGSLGAPIHTSEAEGAWQADEDGAHAVFKLHCDVATPPDAQCLFDITSTVEPITRFMMADVDNTSSANSTEALEDFTDIQVVVGAGGIYDVALEGNTAGGFTNYFTVFIDTSENADWSSFETFEIGSINGSTGEDGQQATATITIPNTLENGEYTLRVVKNYNTSPLDPCGTYSYGQGEDYTLVVDDVIGTDDFSAVDFSYYPNPVGDVLYISGNKTIETIAVYNVLGQEIMTTNNFDEGQVDVSALPTGTLLFKVTFVNGQVENFKVMKK